jgi:hypothetical protein
MNKYSTNEAVNKKASKVYCFQSFVYLGGLGEIRTKN